MKKQGWRGMSDVEKHIEKEALKIMEEGIDFKKLLQDSKLLQNGWLKRSKWLLKIELAKNPRLQKRVEGLLIDSKKRIATLDRELKKIEGDEKREKARIIANPD